MCSSVKTIVSSLPLRLWSNDKRAEIFSQIDDCLVSGGVFLQYTYAIAARRNFYPDHFKFETSSTVWRNVPPAKVECYRSLRGQVVS